MKIREDSLVELTEKEYEVLNIAYNIIGMIGNEAMIANKEGNLDEKDCENFLELCENVISAMDNLDEVIIVEGATST